MKSSRAAIATALSLSALAGIAQGQGLLSIGRNYDDFEQEDIPLTWTAMANLGYDSNINAWGLTEDDSLYVQGGLGAQWSGGSRVTRYTLGASASIMHYFDDVTSNNNENWFYSARLQGSIVHRASNRLVFSDDFYITYEYEPDQFIGAATTNATEQYFYLYNNFAVSYAWTRRFSTIANYAISGIIYDDRNLEDRWTHLFGLQARYSLNPTTTLVGEYRLAYTHYDELDADYLSHYLLAGIDHMFSRTTRGSLRVGAEIRDFDGGNGNQTNPYVEASLTHQVDKQLSLQAMIRYGLEDAELGGYETRDAIRAGLNASYQFNPRLTGTAGLTYVHSEFNDHIVAGVKDGDEDLFGISLGLSYLVASNLHLNGGYSYYTVDSNTPASTIRDHDRHRVHLGVSANF